MTSSPTPDGDRNASRPIGSERSRDRGSAPVRRRRSRLALHVGAAIAAVAALSSCTFLQLSTYEQITGVPFNDDQRANLEALPDTPMKLPNGQLLTIDGNVMDAPAPPPPPPMAQASGRCAQWHDLAIAAGFSESQWATVDRLMWRESGCQPDAYNRSGASGLMQIMKMWADDCGGSPSDLFNPGFNLRCAVHIRNVQGWTAWSTYR